MINFSRLISPSFIFGSQQGALSQGFALFFYIFFGLLIVLAVVAYFMTRKYKKQNNTPALRLWVKLFNFGIAMGAVGYLLLFFRQQRAYFLCMPFLWYLWLLGLIIWLVVIFRWSTTKKRIIEQEIREREEKKKYLP